MLLRGMRIQKICNRCERQVGEMIDVKFTLDEDPK